MIYKSLILIQIQKVFFLFERAFARQVLLKRPVHTLDSVVQTLDFVVRGLYTAGGCFCDYLCTLFRFKLKRVPTE
jgi:hypothetical protein